MAKMLCGAIFIVTHMFFWQTPSWNGVDAVYFECVIFTSSSLTLVECMYVSHDVERGLCIKNISMCKMGLTGLTTPTVHGICTFAIFFSVSQPFLSLHSTLFYERHFVLC